MADLEGNALDKIRELTDILDLIEENRLALYADCPVGLYVLRNGKCVYVNKKLTEMTGLEVEDMIRHDASEITARVVFPDDLPKMQIYVQSRIAGSEHVGVIKFRMCNQSSNNVFLVEARSFAFVIGPESVIVGVTAPTEGDV